LDTVEALTFTIGRADDAAHLFGVSADQVADSLRRVNALDGQERNAYAASSVLGTIIDIALAHQQDCDRANCATCRAIRDGLAANLASLRTLRADAIQRRPVDDAPGNRPGC
jgi:hypothetical protein